MSQMIRTERRWLKSVIAASNEPLPSFPWMRGQRRQAEAPRPEVVEVGIFADCTRRMVPLFGRLTGIAAR